MGFLVRAASPTSEPIHIMALSRSLKKAITGLVALASCLLPSPALAAFNSTAITAQYFGNDAPWYDGRIPIFQSSDSTLNDVYYYRWQIFRAHQRDLGSLGYISTEFLDGKSPKGL